MKAFEVNQRIDGITTRKLFVAANSKRELLQDHDVLEVWERQDVKPEDCPMVFNGRWIDVK